MLHPISGRCKTLSRLNSVFNFTNWLKDSYLVQFMHIREAEGVAENRFECAVARWSRVRCGTVASGSILWELQVSNKQVNRECLPTRRVKIRGLFKPPYFRSPKSTTRTFFKTISLKTHENIWNKSNQTNLLLFEIYNFICLFLIKL